MRRLIVSRQFATPQEIGEREKNADGRFETLATLYAKKKEVLDDDLAREEFKARVRSPALCWFASALLVVVTDFSVFL